MDSYETKLRELGLRALVLLEMHADQPEDYTAKHVFERLAGTYVELAAKYGEWPSEDEV